MSNERNVSQLRPLALWLSSICQLCKPCASLLRCLSADQADRLQTRLPLSSGRASATNKVHLSSSLRRHIEPHLGSLLKRTCKDFSIAQSPSGTAAWGSEQSNQNCAVMGRPRHLEYLPKAKWPPLWCRARPRPSLCQLPWSVQILRSWKHAICKKAKANPVDTGPALAWLQPPWIAIDDLGTCSTAKPLSNMDCW